MPKKTKAFVLAQRDLFDIAATNDTSHLAVALGLASASPTDSPKKQAKSAGDEQATSGGGDASEQRKQVVEYRDKYGFSALHIGACYGHDRICEMLIDAGADVGAATDLGHTPLHAAAENGFGKIVDALLEKGANPAPITRDFLTPLELARRNKHGAIVVTLEPLTKQRIVAGAPLEAAVRGDLLYLLVTVDEGKGHLIATARSEETGDNCLHVICKTAELNDTVHVDGVMRFLLERKLVSVNESNKANMTPLMYAAKLSHFAAVKLLLAHGADPTLAYDKDGNETAWNLAKDERIKRTLLLAMKQREFDDLYATRNDIPFRDRPAFVQQVRAAKAEVTEAQESLAELQSSS